MHMYYIEEQSLTYACMLYIAILTSTVVHKVFTKWTTCTNGFVTCPSSVM